jgi:hypothetical protein
MGVYMHGIVWNCMELCGIVWISDRPVPYNIWAKYPRYEVRNTGSEPEYMTGNYCEHVWYSDTWKNMATHEHHISIYYK